MKMKKIFKRFLCIYLSALVFWGCSTTEPPVENLSPGRRDYTWTVDTLRSNSSMFYLSSLWGESPDNLWAIGSASDAEHSLWHYDGHSWRNIPSISSSHQSIWGFDSSDIWMCDSPGGDLFHYDGNSWEKEATFQYPGYSRLYLNDIWGPNPNEIYIAGTAYEQSKGAKAVLLNYNGNSWNYCNIPDKNYSLISVRKSNENKCLYLTAIKTSGTSGKDIYVIIQYDGKSFLELYKGEELAYPYEMKGVIYICIGQKIYKLKNNSLEEWKNLSGTSFAGIVLGRSENDFFYAADNGLGHYNGKDANTIYNANSFIYSIFILQNDVYCISNYRIIIHGRLKEK